MKVYGSLDFAQLQNLNADPSSPATGLVYFNTSSLAPKWYTGSWWKTFASTDAATTSNAGLVDTNAQTFIGLKTFSAGIIVPIPSVGSGGNVLSGVYNPVLTPIQNTNSASMNGATWFRIGNTVTVFGAFSLNSTASPARAYMSLPITPTPFADFNQAGGVTVAPSTHGYLIYGTIASTTVTLDSTGTPGNGLHSFIFSYTVS